MDETPRSMDEAEIDKALVLTAYHFVLLEAVSSRALAMTEDAADSKGPRSHSAESDGRRSAQSTSAIDTSVGYVDAATSKPSDLVEYRACMELTLIVARHLSNMFSYKSSVHDDDVFAWQLVGVAGYAEGALDKSLLIRINKGSSLHLVNFDDPENWLWRVGDIRCWAQTTLKSFETKLERESPERAELFTRTVATYRTEMGQPAIP